MKKLIFRKSEVVHIGNFLQKPTFKNKKARSRNKLVEKLNEIALQVDADRVQLCEEHAEKDSDGKALVENGTFKIANKDSLHSDLNELFNEEVALNMGEYSENLDPFFKYLESEEFEYELKGEDDIAYNRLLDIWEKAKEDDQNG